MVSLSAKLGAKSRATENLSKARMAGGSMLAVIPAHDGRQIISHSNGLMGKYRQGGVKVAKTPLASAAREGTHPARALQ
jgi:hypothetical protein